MGNFSFDDIPSIEGLKIIEPFLSEDERGSFTKCYEHNIFEENGICFDVSEIFETVSQKNVIRGLHMQHTRPQHKIIRCVCGKVFDVAVDARRDSPTFGKYQSVLLSAENRRIFYIPAGFFHGFMALEDNSVVSYICGGRYIKEYDSGICWDDKDIGIEWPLEDGVSPIISEKDKNALSFKEFYGKYSW